MSNSFDFEEFKAQAIEKLKAGVPLSGKDGVLAPLLENLLNSALEKLVYLAFTRIRKKWTQPVQNWGQTAQQLAILFPDRFRILA